MKYKEGDKVRIKSLDWYNENKDKGGDVPCGEYGFVSHMSVFCGKILTIDVDFEDGTYLMKEDTDRFVFADEMIEGLVEEGVKSEDELLDEYEELTDRAFKGGYEKCKSDIELNGFQLPEGYIFKDENGNEIHALKIVLEKANTLKTQSDNTLKTHSNMETETHRGYYTTEEETTNKSKKVAWFTFGDNDFADKVELDLSNRELIQEDGKWFVVKKKKDYPKTYEECCEVLGIDSTINHTIGTHFRYRDTIKHFIKLLICRDAYWKLYGEEMGLGKPWEPDWSDASCSKYIIDCFGGEICKGITAKQNTIFAFPTEEMRDAFYENFKEKIEICKELL